MLFNNGIRAVDRNKRNKSKQKQGRYENQEAKIILQANKSKRSPQSNAQENAQASHQIALNTKSRKDQRIFQHFIKRNIERDHHQIQIHAHKQIHDDQRCDCKKHQV